MAGRASPSEVNPDPSSITDDGVNPDPSSITDDGVNPDPSSITDDGVNPDPSSITDDGVNPDPSSITDDGVNPDPSGITDDGVNPDPSSIIDDGVNPDPSSITDEYWVYCYPPQSADERDELQYETYGKWMVFKPIGALIDKTWHMIRCCIEKGEFGDGCTGAKCSTSRDTSIRPAGSHNGVICVYTTKEAMDQVGLLLIQKVRQTIRYKTDETTLKGLYAHKGHGKVTVRTIYWNDGEPSIDSRTLPPDVNPTSITDDYWVHCKPPPALQRQGNTVHGKWLVFQPTESLDQTWQIIRRAVEAGEFGKSCTSAKCSTGMRRPGVHPSSDGVINVFTTEEGMNDVGMQLIYKVHRDILYKVHGDRQPYDEPRINRYSYKDRKPTKIWLYWNDGDPSFQQT